MTTILPSLSQFKPNPNWAKLPLFNRKNWPRVRFDDVVENLNETCDPAEAGLDRVIAMEHLEPGSLHIRAWGNVADGTTFTRRCRPGQLLFGKRRAYQRKVAVAEFDAVVSGDIYVLAPKGDRLLPELLPFLCLSERFFQHAVGTSAGSLSPRTNWSSLASFEFDLPPLDQQRRVAEILWAMDEADEKAIQLGLSANAAYESALEDFFFDKKTSDGPCFKQKWQTTQLQNIALPDAPIRYGIVQVLKDCDDGIPTVAIKDLNGDFGESLHKTSPEIEARYANSRIKPGDLLLSIKASVGDVGIVPDHFEGNISRDLARIRCGPQMPAQLLLHLFRSHRYQAYVSKHVVGSTRKEISIHLLRRFEVPLPPAKEASSFLENIAKIQSLQRSVETQVRNLASLRTKLINTILQ